MKGIPVSFFNISNKDRSIERGNILISEPFLDDQWFGRSVISIIDHGEKSGTTGIILNKPSKAMLSEIFNDIEIENVPVFCGGPVGHDHLFFLHTLGDSIIPNSLEISEGLWFGGDFEAIKEYINSGYPHLGIIRFFVGYSGWSQGQLEAELKENSWAVLKSTLDPSLILTGEKDGYWYKTIQHLGEEYRAWSLLPKDIIAN